MKERPEGFLAEEYCPDASEIGDYIKELHEYLWRVVYVVLPNAGGRLEDYIDIAMRELEAKK
ncbi:MAG: hypothetical protein V3W19_11965 [Desulfatiglandales bacterium]